MNNKELLEKLEEMIKRDPMDKMVTVHMDGENLQILRVEKGIQREQPIHFTMMDCSGFILPAVTLHGLFLHLDTLVPVCKDLMRAQVTTARGAFNFRVKTIDDRNSHADLWIEKIEE